MSVAFSEERLEMDQIMEAVARAGMKATRFKADSEEDPTGFWERQGRKIMCSLSGALLGLGIALHASLPLSSAWFYLGAVVSGGWCFPQGFCFPAQTAGGYEPADEHCRGGCAVHW